MHTYGDYPFYATPDNKMITRMLHLPQNKDKIYNKQSVQSVIQCMPEYNTDNRTVYDSLDQICKDTDLYPYINQHKSKRNAEGHFMPFTPGGWVQTMLMQQHQKLRWHYICQPTTAKKSMELGKACSLPC